MKDSASLPCCTAGSTTSRTLAHGQALTLRPARAGLLQVAGGRLWATFDGPHAGPANDYGDRFLQAGDSLEIRAGQRLVIESSDPAQPARFSWNLPAALH